MQRGWVVCADGNVPYGGGFTWNSPGSKTRVEAAIAALTARHKDLVDDQRGLIIGYSIGAMAAWYLLEHSSEPWTGLVFINAEFGVIPKVVKEKGLKRVAMVAARGDMSSGQMSTTARNLARQGIDARFFTFESNNGHFFDNETWKRLMVPLVWALTGE
jgi:pimeloyl-ACP methyl ester carboxylesterase